MVSGEHYKAIPRTHEKSITLADTPYTLTLGYNQVKVDTTGGNVRVNLPDTNYPIDVIKTSGDAYIVTVWVGGTQIGEIAGELSKITVENAEVTQDEPWYPYDVIVGIAGVSGDGGEILAKNKYGKIIASGRGIAGANDAAVFAAAYAIGNSMFIRPGAYIRPRLTIEKDFSIFGVPAHGNSPENSPETTVLFGGYTSPETQITIAGISSSSFIQVSIDNIYFNVGDINIDSVNANLQVRRCQFADASRHAVLLGKTYWTDIEQCRIAGCGSVASQYGAFHSSSNASTVIRLLYNEFVNNPYQDIYGYFQDSSLIMGNYLEGVYVGDATRLIGDSCRIISNKFGYSGTNTDGIVALKFSGNRTNVHDNQFSHFFTAMSTDSTYGNFHDNWMWDCLESIRETTGADYNHIHDNDLCGTGIVKVGANTKIYKNRGYKTDNSGSSTGTGSEQAIPHGLVAIPTGCKAWIKIEYPVGSGRYITKDIPFDATNVYPTVATGTAYNWRIE
jgi:hypothetical protein